MTNKTHPTIGFIGLGLMGSAMVSRLQDLNYSVTVLGRKKRQAIEQAISWGASEASNGKQLAASCDIIMICVDTSDSVESIIFGDNGVLEGIQADKIVVDFGTSIPDSTIKIGKALNEVGAHYLDAPLGRTPDHAKDGLLNIMAAGDKVIFEQVEPVFQDLGENVFHVGKLGAGHTLKLINNFFGMTLATAMSEAFAISDLAGISREDLYSIMSAGPLHSPMMDFVKANAVDGNSKMLAFSIANASKDLGYYLSMVNDLNVSSFIADGTKNALSTAESEGFGEKDVPVMVDFISQQFKQS